MSTPTKITSRLSLRANFAYTLLGNIVYAACQWGMLVSLARLGSAAMVGEFTLGLAIAAPIIGLTSLGLRSIQATDVERRFDFRDYLQLKFATSGFAIFTITIIALAIPYPSEMRLVIIGVGAAKSCEALADAFYGLFQQREQMGLIARSLCLKGPVSLVALSGTLLLTHSVPISVFVLAIAWAALLRFWDFPRVRPLLPPSPEMGSGSSWLSSSWQLRSSLQLAKVSWPLGCTQLLYLLYVTIPRYSLERTHGAASLGTFAACAYFITAGNPIVIALGESASPRLSEYFVANKMNRYLLLLGRLCAGSGFIAGCGIILTVLKGRQLLTLVYGPEYGEQVQVLFVLSVAALFTFVAAILSYGLTAAKNLLIQPVLLALCCAVAMVFSLVYIPKYGAIAAGYAVLAAALTQTIGAAIALAYTLTHRYKRLPRLTTSVPCYRIDVAPLLDGDREATTE